MIKATYFEQFFSSFEFPKWCKSVCKRMLIIQILKKKIGLVLPFWFEFEAFVTIFGKLSASKLVMFGSGVSEDCWLGAFVVMGRCQFKQCTKSVMNYHELQCNASETSAHYNLWYFYFWGVSSHLQCANYISSFAIVSLCNAAICDEVQCIVVL